MSLPSPLSVPTSCKCRCFGGALLLGPSSYVHLPGQLDLKEGGSDEGIGGQDNLSGGEGPGPLQRAPYDRDEVRHLKWLHDPGNAAVLQEGARAGVGNVGQREDDGAHGRGAMLGQPLVKLPATPAPRHGAIYEDDVELVLLQADQRLFGVGKARHGSAVLAEHLTLELQHRLLIVHQKDSALQRHLFAGWGRRGHGDALLYAGRQEHAEHGAALGMVQGHDLAAVLLEDAVANAQPQPGSLAHALGGVEGVEDAMWLADARAVVAELDAHLLHLRVDAHLQPPALARLQRSEEHTS